MAFDKGEVDMAEVVGPRLSAKSLAGMCTPATIDNIL
jgi:hypothetical protein